MPLKPKMVHYGPSFYGGVSLIGPAAISPVTVPNVVGATVPVTAGIVYVTAVFVQVAIVNTPFNGSPSAPNPATVMLLPTANKTTDCAVVNVKVAVVPDAEAALNGRVFAHLTKLTARMPVPKG
jgi:hypothetical protein